jgi:hypothetical protein
VLLVPCRWSEGVVRLEDDDVCRWRLQYSAGEEVEWEWEDDEEEVEQRMVPD